MDLYGNLDSSFPGLQYGMDSQEKISSAIAMETINFGAPVMGYVGEEGNAYNTHRDKSTLLLDGDLIASNVYTIVINGVTIAREYAVSHAATMTALINDINISTDIDDLDGQISAAAGGSNREIVIKSKGLDLTITGAVTLGNSQAGVTITYSVWANFLGIAGFIQKGGRESGAGTSAYLVGDMVNVVEAGQRYVKASVAVQDKQLAYIVYVPGSTQGQFTNSASGTFDCGCIFRSNRATNNYAALEVRGLK